MAGLDGPNVGDFSLVCWNVDRNSTKEIIDYLHECKADLYFLQEEDGKLNDKFSEEYKAYCVREVLDKKPPQNCIVYNKNKFDENKDQIEAMKQFSEADKEQHVCVVILQCTTLPSKPKIIVASCHVPKTTVSKGKSPWTPPEDCNSKDCKAKKCSSEKCKKTGCNSKNCSSKIAHYANGMLQALDELGQATSYPVIVAGDFNCDLLKQDPKHIC